MAVASQIYWLSKDILHGDGSCGELTVSPRYPPMRIPATPFTVQYQAEGRLCADFAQIYFPALNMGALQNAYTIETSIDPWHRPSRYPPLVHLICAYTLCQLPYGQASLIHIALQTILYIASFVFAFSVLGLRKYLLPALLLLNVCLFLTPVGLSFFERGQLTLYVGLCYLWLMLAFVTGKRRYVIISALFGFVKWTAFPFVFVAFAVSVLISRNVRELKQRMIAAGLFALLISLLLLFLPESANFFVQGLVKQELGMVSNAMGNALVRIVPLHVVKSVPFVLIVIGFLCRFTSSRSLPCLVPLFAGAATLLVTYPTFAFDYSVPYLTAFIPFMIYWAKLPRVDHTIGGGGQCLLFAFLPFASFAFYIFNYSEIMVIVTYVTTALALICVPFLEEFLIDNEKTSYY